MVLKRPAVSRDLFLLQGLAFVQSKDYRSAVRDSRVFLGLPAQEMMLAGNVSR